MQFDLVCDQAVYGSLAISIGSIGEAIVSIPLGLLSDRYGRLWTLYPCLFIMITVGFASAFATKYWHFLVSRLFSGAVMFGVIYSISSLSGEFVGPRYRPLSQIVTWVAATFELLILTLMAYFVRTWRTLTILCTAPWIVGLVFAKLVLLHCWIQF